LRGDRLACGAESAFAIGELDFGGSAALLRLAYARRSSSIFAPGVSGIVT
jgi:hypothetical protein